MSIRISWLCGAFEPTERVFDTHRTHDTSRQTQGRPTGETVDITRKIALPLTPDGLDGAVRGSSNTQVMSALGVICARHALDALGGELAGLATLLSRDLAGFETELAAIGGGTGPVVESASHLLGLGGKRLRPAMVALSARLGRGFDERGLQLALAAELVHAATLLHDDVVDLGTMRRGRRAARVVYGNAASIFAGDWLLVEALRRVRRADCPGVLDRLLSVIEEMIGAEALQLERRGRLSGARLAGSKEEYLRISVGKTASLFRWAVFAGGTAGELGPEHLASLDAFALDLGVAFQLADDVLDLGGAGAAGKSVAADLREGKLTFPMLSALERDPDGELLRLLLEIAETRVGSEDVPEALAARATAKIREAGGISAATELARARVTSAKQHLAALPAGSARTLLAVVADSIGRQS